MACKKIVENPLEDLRGLRLLTTDEQIPTFEKSLGVYAWSGSGELPAADREARRTTITLSN